MPLQESKEMAEGGHADPGVLSFDNPRKVRSCVLRWNGQWIPGDRFARDYATGVDQFASELTQAISRFHPGRYCPTTRDHETNAVACASVLVAFDAASFGEIDRGLLLEAVLTQLRARWHDNAGIPLNAEAILERVSKYVGIREPQSPLATAARFVESYLAALGIPVPCTSTLARHLQALVSYRILRDIYRLSSAATLRKAVVTLLQQRRLA